MGAQQSNDLNWLAFAYVAGEMSADEAESFELRLADDQQAREAVARAVELTQVVAAAETHCEQSVTVAHRQAPSWSTRLAWMAIGGVAAVLVALFVSSMNTGPQPVVKQDDARPAPSNSKVRELALAWSSTRALLADSEAADSEAGLWYPAHLAAVDSSEATADDVDHIDAEAVAEAPSWMTAGVFGLAGKTPEEVLDYDESPEPFSCERGDN